MTIETVRITCGGRVLRTEEFEASLSVEQAVRQASATVVPDGPGLPCLPGEAVTIHFVPNDAAGIATGKGDLYLTGSVQDVRPQHGATTRRYDVTFVSKTVDNVESSVEHPTGEVENGTLTDIAKTLDTLDIGVDSDVTGFVKGYHKLDTGESWFDSIEREARAQGAFVYDTPEGRHKIADKPQGRHAGTLTRGHLPYIEGDALLTQANRHSEVKIRGQAARGTKAASLRAQTVASDPGMTRKRVLIKLFEGDVDSSRMKQRAVTEAKRAAGNATTANILVLGWRDEKGRIWAPHFLIPVASDWLGIDQDMVIKAIQFSQGGRQGTTARLALVDPRALGGENPRGKSAAAWSAPAALEPIYEEF